MQEEGALRDFPTSASDGGLDAARDQEENPEDSFVSTVSSSRLKTFAKKSLKLSLKSMLPFFGVIVLLVGSIIFSFISGAWMPFAVVSRMVEEFNTVGITSVVRSDNLFDLQLSMIGEPLGLSEYQQSALKEQGFLVTEYNNSYVIGYERPGNKYAVVATTQIANSGDEGALAAIAELFPSGAQPTFDSNNPLVSPAAAFNDAAFSTPFTTAAKLWRGGIAGWYDSVASLSTSVHGYSRSRWAAYVANGADNIITEFASIAASSAKKAQSAAASVEYAGPDGEALQTDSDGKLLIDADGNYRTVDGDSPVSPSSVTQISSTASAALNAAQIADRFASAARTASNTLCAGVEGLISVQTLLSAYNRLNKMNLASSFVESTQLAQYNQIIGGPSTGADPMHEHLERLTAVDDATGKNAMQSQGIGALMAGDAVDSNNSSVLTQNSEKLVTDLSADADFATDTVAKIMNGGGNLLQAMTYCNYANAAISLVSATASGISLALSIPTLGISGVISAAISAGAKGAAKSAVEAALGIVLPIIATKIISRIGENFMKDAATEWFGTDEGDALVSGVNAIFSSNSQTGSSSPGSAAEVGAFRSVQTAVIAKEAEYQRAVRSPLDPTSRYTFLGSLAYAAIPFASSPTISNSLKSLASLTRNSLTVLLPSASAVAETSLVGLAKPGDCPILEQARIQGDIYCNALIVEDSTYLSSSLAPQPNEALEYELSHENIKQSGDSYIINTDKKANPLARFAQFCGQRVSNWGIPDANIASALKDESSSTLKSVLSAIPIVGDIVSVVDAATDQKNLPWTTGSACVASDSNPYWAGSDDAHNNRMHQAFLSSDRWLENTGLSETSVVATYMEDYYSKNPLDNSFEGILARYSGMTKESVIATLDLMAGLTYIAKYHPEERQPVEKMQNLFTPVKDFIQNIKPTLASLGSQIKQTLPVYKTDPTPELSTLRNETYIYA